MKTAVCLVPFVHYCSPFENLFFFRYICLLTILLFLKYLYEKINYCLLDLGTKPPKELYKIGACLAFILCLKECDATKVTNIATKIRLLNFKVTLSFFCF